MFETDYRTHIVPIRRSAMKYDCLIIDDEKLLADSTTEYLTCSA